jgi:excisionase family DNA binding protein
MRRRNPVMTERAAYPVSEARELLGGISRSSLYRLIAAGQIRVVKLGSRTLVPASEIERLVGGQLGGEDEATERGLTLIDGGGP